ncbi:hypothetical protein NHP21005_02130 [Helicobacter sp. NHP21005]|uniref:hypothetical protein n=1 Tax=Helicobacter felistomachi TaxID=3040201 RepID=UPI002572A05F|nr:hypothetical protein [Helicobacter sp. NHP21005]BEG56525.1 hypothetical protein NHP21005_02130 [Helicobacter sp. NHP21005]
MADTELIYETLKGEYCKVKHISGTSDYIPNPEARTWIEFYKTYSGDSNPICCNAECNESASIGAHVKVDRIGNKYYIVPVCSSHNPPRAKDPSWVVKSGTRAVPQNLEKSPQKGFWESIFG